jgi:hypothetical protein
MEDAFAKMNFALQDGSTVVNFRGSGGVFVSIAESKVEAYESIWRTNKKV